MERLPTVLVIEIYNYLDAPFWVLNFSGACKTTHQALVALPDAFWRTILRHNIHANFDLLVLKEGQTWKRAAATLWKDLAINWSDVLSDPHFFGRASFLLCEHAEDVRIFGDHIPNIHTSKLVDEESLVNSFGDDEIFEELFDSRSNVEEFLLQCCTLQFNIPDNNKLKIIIGGEGLYFFLNDMDIGRLDGHQSMPALRWDEVKRIADYQRLPTCYNLKKDHILLILSYLSFPMPHEVEEFAEMTGQAFVSTAVIDPSEVASWREVLQFWTHSNVTWTEEPAGVWTHPWSSRNIFRPDFSREISNFLREDQFV